MAGGIVALHLLHFKKKSDAQSIQTFLFAKRLLFQNAPT